MTDLDGAPVATLTEPTPEAARELVERGVDDGALVTLVGRCTVSYEGRAASTLGPGDRLLVLKRDGTALVHSEDGQKPVNWQPPGCEHDVAVEDGGLVVHSERTTPDEELSVRFADLYHAASYAISDPTDLALTGTEADLRDRVLDDPDLVETGFTPVATEYETPAGAVDVYGEDARGNDVVLELKRRRVGPDAVGQLGRYVRALDGQGGDGETDDEIRDSEAGDATGDEERGDGADDAGVRGVLVAPSVTDRAGELLAERGLEFVALAPTPSE